MRPYLLAVGLLAATMLAPVAGHAANVNNPYGNVDHRNDAGNDTGDSQVDRLNEQQLQNNGIPRDAYNPGYAAPPGGPAAPGYAQAPAGYPPPPPPPGYRPPPSAGGYSPSSSIYAPPSYYAPPPGYPQPAPPPGYAPPPQPGGYPPPGYGAPPSRY